MFALLVFILLGIKTGSEANTLMEASRVRIVGGVEVVPHSLPYQAAIITNQSIICGGVLISNEHILTSAHCVIGAARSIEVILGAHNIEYYEDTQKTYFNPKVIIHENYSSANCINDIAILKLNQLVEFSWAIRPMRNLADSFSGDLRGSTGLLSGWGYTYHSASHIECNLRQVYLDIISNYKCKQYESVLKTAIKDSHLCTSGEDSMVGSVGACNGDSGGPLVIDDTIVGLVSFGGEICEAGYPTVYTRISFFREWILKHSGV